MAALRLLLVGLSLCSVAAFGGIEYLTGNLFDGQANRPGEQYTVGTKTTSPTCRSHLLAHTASADNTGLGGRMHERYDTGHLLCCTSSDAQPAWARDAVVEHFCVPAPCLPEEGWGGGRTQCRQEKGGQAAEHAACVPRASERGQPLHANAEDFENCKCCCCAACRYGQGRAPLSSCQLAALLIARLCFAVPTMTLAATLSATTLRSTSSTRTWWMLSQTIMTRHAGMATFPDLGPRRR